VRGLAAAEAGMSDLAPGDRVRIRPDRLAAWCTLPATAAAWRDRRGTVDRLGKWRPDRAYVVWDGCRTARVVGVTFIEKVEDQQEGAS
jgi:hypothetical protein